mmetsp:Transcript_3736/g.4251  ORF Transcript_3736/g.4251 Transcript_3736/m.4251 type:complete len:158 (-) Transcript_3736:489-962(-)
MKMILKFHQVATARSFSRSVVASKAISMNVRHLTDSSSSPSTLEYVHPLSQIVLEHLQSTRQDWVKEKGLNENLKINPDGTFEMRFLSDPNDNSRIWTTYDKEEKKHWLIAHKGELVGQCLLQDNLKTAWQDEDSPTERITDAVDAMIERINASDNE